MQPLTDTLHEVIITDSKGKYCFHRCLSTGGGSPKRNCGNVMCSQASICLVGGGAVSGGRRG